ncbi:hypothetical protein GDO78_006747 [Eleutherodactylus coqui]|uniref:Uncharacterized protein n=1 Tax=Eleutherodactylus coqui TaxID=57060 RepID=A0A8J6FH51_ELECQ|nr:hypothetical protein GDO78_006747 [Eleutherodactylus coqui]
MPLTPWMLDTLIQKIFLVKFSFFFVLLHLLRSTATLKHKGHVISIQHNKISYFIHQYRVIIHSHKPFQQLLICVLPVIYGEV